MRCTCASYQVIPVPPEIVEGTEGTVRWWSMKNIYYLPHFHTVNKEI